MRVPLLVLHVICGTLGMLSGFAAMFLRKGSRRHAVAGRVFVITMLNMSASGAILAAMKSQPGNAMAGALTFCLVGTGWVTASREQWKTGAFDWGGLLITSSVAALALTCGLEAALSPTGLKYGDSASSFFILGSVALLAALGDLRLAVRGTITATQRLVRHLWRMCVAQLVAAVSIFLAREELFPALLRRTGILTIVAFSPLAVMLFWMIRVRFKSRSGKVELPGWIKQPAVHLHQRALLEGK